MGVKGCMLVYADTDVRETLKARPLLDRDKILKRANSLFASDNLISVADGILGWYTFPLKIKFTSARSSGFRSWSRRILESITRPNFLNSSYVIYEQRWRASFRFACCDLR